MSAVKQWRVPTRQEFPVAIAALAKVIGDHEAVLPDWTRRLVLSEPDGQWCLLVEDCAARTPYVPIWDDKTALQVFRLVYPIGEAVSILQGPANPEGELSRRRAEIEAHEKEVREQKAAEDAARLAKRAEAEQLAADKLRFNASDWDKLTDAQRLALALALRVESRDPVLASDLREIGSHRILDFPRAKWSA
jgi:hypothetical protein